MSDINVGQLSEVINNKMDRDLNNRSTDSGLRKLVESYVNGTSWYKVFDEIQANGSIKKWCEQGSVLATSTTGSAYESGTKTLLKPFIDTNYSLFLQNSGNDTSYEPKITDKTTSTFSYAYVEAYQTNLTNWLACGYIS